MNIWGARDRPGTLIPPLHRVFEDPSGRWEAVGSRAWYGGQKATPWAEGWASPAGLLKRRFDRRALGFASLRWRRCCLRG